MLCPGLTLHPTVFCAQLTICSLLPFLQSYPESEAFLPLISAISPYEPNSRAFLPLIPAISPHEPNSEAFLPLISANSPHQPNSEAFLPLISANSPYEPNSEAFFLSFQPIRRISLIQRPFCPSSRAMQHNRPATAQYSRIRLPRQNRAFSAPHNPASSLP